MEIKEYKTDFRKSFLEFLPGMISLPIVYVGRTIHNRKVGMDKDTAIIMLIIAISMVISLLFICFLRQRKLLVFEDHIIEKGIFNKRQYLYKDIEVCFYDGVQKKLSFVINGNVSNINIGRYDIDNVIKELERHLDIERT